MARSRDQRPNTPNDEAMTGLFRADHRPSHDDKWRDLGPDDAPLARQAVVVAQEIRESDVDAGNAYLRGMADALAWYDRQRWITEIQATIDALPESAEQDGLGD